MAATIKPKPSSQTHEVGVITSQIEKLHLNSEDRVLRSIATKILSQPLSQINLPFFSAQITFSGHFQIMKILGEGSYGVAVLVKDNHTQEQKVFKIARGERFNKYLEDEYLNLKNLNKIDPLHTVRAFRCHKLFMDLHKKTKRDGGISEMLLDPRVVIISDYGGKEVYRSLVKEALNILPFQDFMHLFCQALSYWKQLTVNGLVQKDIKPENMLLDGPLQTPGSLKFIDPSALGKKEAPFDRWYINSRYFRSPTSLWEEFSPHETSFAIAASFFEILTGSTLFRTYISAPESREKRMKRHLECVFDTVGFPKPPYFKKINPRLRATFFKKTTTPEGKEAYIHLGRVTKDPFPDCSTEEKSRRLLERLERKILDALQTKFYLKEVKDLEAIAKELMEVFLMILKNHEISPDDVLKHNLFKRFPDIVAKHCTPVTAVADESASFYTG